MGSPSGSVGGGSSSGGASSTDGRSSSSSSSSSDSFDYSVSDAQGSRDSSSTSSSDDRNARSGDDDSDEDGAGRSGLSTSSPSNDLGLTASQSDALAESAAVMDGFALSSAGAATPDLADPEEEDGFFESAGDAIVGSGEMLGGIAVGAGDRAIDLVSELPSAAWEGVNMVNDAAGTILDTAIGWTGLDWFEGHSERNAARGQAMLDGVLGVPDQIAAGWETFEDNWEAGNFYGTGRQIGGIGLDTAAIVVPASKLGALGRVDDLMPAVRAASTELDDVLREIREAGAEIVTDRDPDVKAYLDDAARREGIAPEDMHASTLGDTIVVRDHLRDDVVTLREELEHVRQQREGRVSVGADGFDTRVDLEIEARERMLERDDLTVAERAQIQGEIDTIRERGRY